MAGFDIVLPGTLKSASPLQTCCKCGEGAIKEGGVETKPGRFTCARCWRGKLAGLQVRNKPRGPRGAFPRAA